MKNHTTCMQLAVLTKSIRHTVIPLRSQHFGHRAHNLFVAFDELEKHEFGKSSYPCFQTQVTLVRYKSDMTLSTWLDLQNEISVFIWVFFFLFCFVFFGFFFRTHRAIP